MKRVWTGICAGAVASLIMTAAARAETFTLGQALGVAYETNPQLDAQRAALRATDESVAKANGGWRPSINAQGSYGHQQYQLGSTTLPATSPLQGQVTVTQPIFRGGRTWAEISQAKAVVRAGRAQLTGVEQSVLLAAVTAYMDVVRDQAIVELRLHNVETLKKQASATELQF